MNPVLSRIRRHCHAFARAPLCARLLDERVPPHERLAFVPRALPVVSALDDLTRLAGHATHRPWYPPRWAALADAGRRRASETPPHPAWGAEAALLGRLRLPALAALARHGSPAVRLTLGAALGAAGTVLHAVTAPVARQAAAEAGRRATGAGPGADQGLDALDTWASLHLAEPERRQALQAADTVFAWFTAWTNDLAKPIVHDGAPRAERASFALR